MRPLKLLSKGQRLRDERFSKLTVDGESIEQPEAVPGKAKVSNQVKLSIIIGRVETTLPSMRQAGMDRQEWLLLKSKVVKVGIRILGPLCGLFMQR